LVDLSFAYALDGIDPSGSIPRSRSPGEVPALRTGVIQIPLPWP
jgi:hypothetical protein